jgi:mono/diheme cytochrome c family protein
MSMCLHPKNWLAVTLFAAALVSSLFAGVPEGKPEGTKDISCTPDVQSSSAGDMRVEGERRFHANCGRCHAAPQKFPPRMMATVLRHMRVRATITAEDRRLILFYMTQ